MALLYIFYIFIKKKRKKDDNLKRTRDTDDVIIIIIACLLYDSLLQTEPSFSHADGVTPVRDRAGGAQSAPHQTPAGTLP